MGGVDDLFHEVGQSGVPDNPTADEHAIGLCVELVSEIFQATRRRGMKDAVVIASISHPLLQVSESFRKLRALFWRDRGMIQRQTDVKNGDGHRFLLLRAAMGRGIRDV